MPIRLDDRAVLKLEGPDADRLLQGILTNDIGKLTPERALYAALLTPQGKLLFDFFLARRGDAILIDCPAVDREALLRKLTLYRLRSKVDIEDVSEGWHALASLDAGQEREPGACRKDGGCLKMTDPRSAMMGERWLCPRDELPSGADEDAGDYERHRLRCGIPDLSIDGERDKTLALEAGLDRLHAVDFQKGCYVGQELTARTHYRGKVRKKLVGLSFEGPAPAIGSALLADGAPAGAITSAIEGHAIALARFERLANTDLRLDDGRSFRLKDADRLDEAPGSR